MLLLDDGAIPGAMTEEWFSSAGSTTAAPIQFIDARGGARELKLRKFKVGETVPPCGSCELIVPLLLCNQKVTCSHKT